MEFRNETSMEVYTSPSSCIYSKNYKILINCFRTSENGIYTIIFFLEHAGELRIFVLRRREWPIYITDHPPWARMGDG